MKGGQIVNYNIYNAWHTERFRPLYNHDADCGANCFYMLGYCNFESANYLATRTGEEGLMLTTILYILNYTYAEGNHEWTEIPIGNLHLIRQYLIYPNRATMGFISYDDGTGHFFVIFTGNNAHGVFNLALDAQSGETYPLHEYLTYHHPVEFHLLNSDTSIDGHDMVTPYIINRFM